MAAKWGRTLGAKLSATSHDVRGEWVCTAQSKVTIKVVEYYFFTSLNDVHDAVIKKKHIVSLPVIGGCNGGTVGDLLKKFKAYRLLC